MRRETTAAATSSHDVDARQVNDQSTLAPDALERTKADQAGERNSETNCCNTASASGMGKILPEISRGHPAFPPAVGPFAVHGSQSA
jgi:hypothetical protein